MIQAVTLIYKHLLARMASVHCLSSSFTNVTLSHRMLIYLYTGPALIYS